MQINTDNMYKHLKSNTKRDGYIHRAYDNGLVLLRCSIREITDPKEDDAKLKWLAHFLTHETGREHSAQCSWDVMVDKYERMSLEAKVGQREVVFGDA